ncbi:TQO small subunit DoxD [Modestobacter sp. DSM 44400]|uniref:TQO small subunit DoxD n=1 Tax=Modestobacter sp. DSM 44400 TaxID=1550230 RepID=UPI0008995E79|nr:TQO small subunit DoxD [Modestobacter sp. DSM 44400]SDX71772.1 TQO small subunit DoxD [Modestobacter sp. DSM 44400]
MTAPAVEGPDQGKAARATLAAVRIALGLLWIQGVGWKTPPDFGQEAGRGLFRYTRYAVDHPVLPPFSWLIENLVLPHFVFFGYLTLLLEASIGAFLLVGLATRFWAAMGIVQTTAITLSVLNAPNEWPWSYYLMFAAHVVVLTTAAGRSAGMDGQLRPVWRRSPGRVARVLLRVS